jgi:hypothetical protein
MELDVVTYPLPGGALGLGAVERVRVSLSPSLLYACCARAGPASSDVRDGAAQVRGGSVTLSPLARERDSGLWVERCSTHDAGSSGAERDGASASVSAALASLRRLDAAYAQRAVADRVANPHGEHAENTWEVRCVARSVRAHNLQMLQTLLTHLCCGVCACAAVCAAAAGGAARGRAVRR